MTTLLERPAPAPVPAARAPRRRSEWRHRVVPLLLVLAGIAVILYPVGATYWNNYHQRQFAQRYQDQTEKTAPVTLNEALAKAEQYNAALPPGQLQDPWKPEQAATNAQHRAYLAQLNLFDAMARIRIPSIKVDLPVYHGTSDETLARGIGHLYGSTLPVGGPGTHAVLTGHSSLENATMFDHLPQVKVGDRFYVDVYGRTLAYEVDQVKVVLPDQLGDLVRTPGADQVTLVTCTPYAVNTHRLLVRGHRVAYDPAADPTRVATGMDWSIESWMWPRLIGAGVGLLVLLVMVALWIRGDRRRARRRAALAAARATKNNPTTPTEDV
ncbi:class C sortase [Knoellia koreensis]|uniref:Class C sortase n=1 Tax=Knoellia koreensis TaxID=2730921 RepID=A0A849HRN5_9MICO|nr:class C sortase [Knoellia sp. DB2414S]NNM47257.1 class C sortase [Knoellia sp. DB2414S]